MRDHRNGYLVDAECRRDLTACPKCGAADPPPHRHGTKPAVVRKVAGADKPIRAVVRRGRFRCRACRHVFAVPLDGRDAWTPEVVGAVLS